MWKWFLWMRCWASRLIVCSIGLLYVQNAVAQTFVPVKNEVQWRQQLAVAAKNMKSIRADFVQEKVLSMLKDKLISKGTFALRQDQKVRLEYTTPFKYVMVINNGKIAIQDDNKTTQLDLHKNKMFQQINKIIVDGVQGNVANSADFNTHIFESPTQLKLEMVPIPKSMKELFSSIVVTLDKKDFSAVKMVMNERSGDYTSIQFKNKELNATLPDQLFVVH